MLISICVFMIFIAFAVGSFASLVKANKTANEAQKLYREMRFVLDALAAEIRNNKIDFDCMAAKDVPECNENASDNKIILGVKHKDSSKAFYRLNNGKIQTYKDTTGWQEMTSSELAFEKLSFKVFPLQDPYESGNYLNDSVQYQPSVTIELTAKGRTLKTTYSSRSYGGKSLYDYSS